MKVLLVGGGGREHALAWKITQSPKLTTLYCSPGNPGIDTLVKVEPFLAEDIAGIVALAEAKSIDLAVIGPEAPLAEGLGDHLRKRGIACFGPDAGAARLETSKGFMKDLCAAHQIPTARYARVTSTHEAAAFLDTLTAPYVIKADGLAAGKGVIIAPSRTQANAAVTQMLAGQFGDAGTSLVIEEFLTGEEVSFFVVCDGQNAVPLLGVQDHKRAGEGDTGPNTGGMGAYAPAPIFTPEIEARVMTDIIAPTLGALQTGGTPFIGVLFAGLMITADGPKLIEYNVRFGDPECQVLMRLMTSDILPLLKAAADGALGNDEMRAAIAPQWSAHACALVVMASKGYPGAYEKGQTITGIQAASAHDGVTIFHAGTRMKENTLTNTGGRVLNVTATAPTLREAVARTYKGVSSIEWPDGFYRRDIGWRALDAGSGLKPAEDPAR
ncbi:MAG: phosphoribosylamine--glycine ligase [Pseudomonadota bacterium]